MEFAKTDGEVREVKVESGQRSNSNFEFSRLLRKKNLISNGRMMWAVD